MSDSEVERLQQALSDTQRHPDDRAILLTFINTCMDVVPSLLFDYSLLLVEHEAWETYLHDDHTTDEANRRAWSAHTAAREQR
jgi:hypothetical protein